MNTVIYTQYNQLEAGPHFEAFKQFSEACPNGNFFQAAPFFAFAQGLNEYRPFLILALSDELQIAGSLLGTVQTTGTGPKSWLSRRLIVTGGPLLHNVSPAFQQKTAARLLEALKKYARSRAIYIEFRNLFDTSPLRAAFETCGFTYREHLNYLVKTGDAAAVKKRMSDSRWRQINSSLKAGAAIEEPGSEADIRDFYEILDELYREKVRKPLPGLDFFLHFQRSGAGKFFLVRWEGRVVGGIVCPVFAGRVIYEWYVCGKDGEVKGLHPSVLATWAPIAYGLENGFSHFDFLGAGRPDEDYGVREFKARFGGEEVAYGRYLLVVKRYLYRLGKTGLKYYQLLKQSIKPSLKSA